MGVPRIGVTTYGRDERGWFELPGDYVDALRRAGALPILLPPGEPRLDEWLAQIDGLVLTGGGDIDPERYGGAPLDSTYMVDAERDAMEFALVRHALDTGLPTLCICRGTQVVNLALGGTLHEHLPDVVGEGVLHRLPSRKPTPHPIQLESGCRLASILEVAECSPMSWHHQAVHELGRGLEVVARAPDGVIEAVELPTHPWLVAVQWHPELTAAEDPTQQRLFDALSVEAARRDKESSCD
jgi:putative glutamine amidotransferase